MQQYVLQNSFYIGDAEENTGDDKNEKVFASIFETYYKKVYNYIYYRVYCQYTTEDLTSHVFEKVMGKVETYSRSKAPFEVWLFAITRNVVNDYFRAQKKHRIISLDTMRELVSRKKDPEGIVMKGESKDALSKALGTLNDRERNIVALKFGAGLKNKEIAEILGITESNTGIVLYRLLKKMREVMEREESL